DDPERWIFAITEYFSLLNTPADQRLRIGYGCTGLFAHLMKAHLEDNRSTTTIAKPNDLVQVQHLEETTFHKSNKVEETKARVEATVHKKKATTEKEETIKDRANTLTSLQSEVASLEKKGSVDANDEIKKDHTLVYELEKQVEKLPMELQLKNNVRGALETKDLTKMMINLNPTLHDLQEVKTKCALKINDEEFKKAKSEATRKIRKLEKVYDAWLPPWLASRLVVYQPYVKNHWKEFMFIQGRIWDSRINIYFRHHFEDKVVVKEWE
nr:myosin heavy chain-related protein [Tanacetum cinerariifolium]